MVEVHIASGASQYKTIIQHFPTGFGSEIDGTWLMADYDRDGIPDLVFIKTPSGPGAMVEVHIASGASQYKTIIHHFPTIVGSETDGTWLMADYDRNGIPDLVFIKTNNTPSNMVEVHITSGGDPPPNHQPGGGGGGGGCWVTYPVENPDGTSGSETVWESPCPYGLRDEHFDARLKTRIGEGRRALIRPRTILIP